MRYLMIVLLAFGSVISGVAADEVTYVPKEKVAEAMSKGGSLTRGSNYIVSISRRDKPGRAEVHETETDTFYIMEGSATFVTGGTVVDGKTTRPGQILGASLDGGQSHTLSKGDVIVIPKGTPHWFKEVQGIVVYYVVKAM
jgi:mannose-6-phosphate isomerase-like protein (cupin superfamily)